MIDCKYMTENGTCAISDEIAAIPVPLDEQACEACSKSDPPQTLNRVTYCRAAWALRQRGIKPSDEITKGALDLHDSTVGTELKNLISWFVWDESKRKCPKCRTREQIMNRWGPSGCHRNMETIVAWLEESARENGYPFSKKGAEALVNLAIKKSKSN